MNMSGQENRCVLSHTAQLEIRMGLNYFIFRTLLVPVRARQYKIIGGLVMHMPAGARM